MKTREQLQEEYEAALFALMMDYMAQAEGKRLREENERLKNDPAAQIPESLDQRCLQTIQRAFLRREAAATIMEDKGAVLLS